jgi:integrase
MRGSIVKRKTGYFIVYDTKGQWDAKKQKIVRKQKWEKVSLPNTRKHAQSLLSDRLSQLHSDEFVEPTKMTFAEFKDKWVDHYACGQVRESTMSLYNTLFRRHLIPFFGDFSLAEIRVEDVQSFKSSKLKQSKYSVLEGSGSSKVLSPQTVKHMLRLLRQILDHAVSWGYLRKNVARNVKFPPIPKREADCLSPEEARVFLKSVDQKWYAFFLTAIVTGLRLGELLGMKWENLDWKKGQYYVKETVLLSREGRPASLGQPKTLSSMGNVDLTPASLNALKELYDSQNEQSLKTPNQFNGLMFSTSLGGLHDHRNIVRRVFEPTLKTAGLRTLRFHGLRHTCASLLIAQGESPKYVQKQLRHASVQITFDTYGHLFHDVNTEAGLKMDLSIVAKESV